MKLLALFLPMLALTFATAQARPAPHRGLWVCEAVAYHRIPGLNYQGWGSYAGTREAAYESAMAKCRARAGYPSNCMGWGCVQEGHRASSLEIPGQESVGTDSVSE